MDLKGLSVFLSRKFIQFSSFNLSLLLKIEGRFKRKEKKDTTFLPEKADTCAVDFRCYYKENTPEKCKMDVAPKFCIIFLSQNLSLPCTQHFLKTLELEIYPRECISLSC